MSGDEEVKAAALAEVREVVRLAMLSGASFAECCGAALDAAREVEIEIEGAANALLFSAGPGLEDRALRAAELRRLARMVDSGEVSALVLGYRVEVESEVMLTLVAADPRVGLEKCEALIEALDARFNEGC